MPHPCAAGVTAESLGRFRGSVGSVQHRLAHRVWGRQHGIVDMKHHLIALPGSAGVELVVQGSLRQQRQCVRVLLQVGGRWWSGP